VDLAREADLLLVDIHSQPNLVEVREVAVFLVEAL
jgi:hypothetical protein